MNIKEKIYRPIFLILIYLIITIAALASFQEHGVHIEEKYHRLNGLFWLNHIAQIFNFENLMFSSWWLYLTNFVVEYGPNIYGRPKKSRTPSQH